MYCKNVTKTVTPRTGYFRISPATVINYFPSKVSQQEFLRCIDKTWQNRDLFSQHANLQEYIESILSRAFLCNGKNLRLDENTRKELFKELDLLNNHPDLSPRTKAVCITQAIQLALYGIDTTPVLNKINSNYLVVNNSNIIQDNTKGYRGELFACWYLAKFVYKLDHNSTVQFKHSAILKTHDRIGRFAPRMCKREVDLVTDDAVVSIKSRLHKGRLGSQILTLFFEIVDNNLQGKTKRIILVKRAGEFYQCTPDYKLDKAGECEIIKQYARDNARKRIFQEFKCPDSYKKYFDELEIEIYFLPDFDDEKNLAEWIEMNYDWLYQKNSYYLYSLVS